MAKEIENYLIVPQMLYRLAKAESNGETYESFRIKLERVLDEFENEVHDQYLEQMMRYRTEIALSTCSADVRKIMQEKWNGLDGKIGMVSGKKAITKINIWLKQEYGINSSYDKMIKELRNEEICDEIVEVLEELS